MRLAVLITRPLDAYGRWQAQTPSYFVLFGRITLLLLFRATGTFGKEH